MTVQNLVFRAHSLCMSYVTKTFLLVRSSVRSKQLLCFVHGHGNVPLYLNLLLIQPTEGKEGLLVFQVNTLPLSHSQSGASQKALEAI